MLTDAASEPSGVLGRVERILRRAETHPTAIFVVLAGVYVASVLARISRPLWFDELFTYYVVTAPSFGKAVDLLLHVDLNPPLGYLPAWVSIQLFGPSPAALRVPSALAFGAASVLIFRYARWRLGFFSGVFAVAAFWMTGYLYWAAEARSYALLLFFLTAACYQWARLAAGESRSHWLLSVLLACLLLTHCYAGAFLLGFYVAQIIRDTQNRRIYRAAWVSLLAPLSALVLYIPLVGRAGTLIATPDWQASVARVVWVYVHAFFSPSIPMLVVVGLSVLFLAYRKRAASAPRLPAHEAGLLAGTLASPLIVAAVIWYMRGPFWPRYTIGMAVGVSLLTAAFVAGRAGRQRLLPASLVVFLLGAVVVTDVIPTVLATLRLARVVHNLVPPELAVVAGSPINFIEADHREPPDFVRRLVYLDDPETCLRYTGSNHTIGWGSVKGRFPIRAAILPYAEFTKRERHFLVWADQQFPEEWILQKLRDDGWRIRPVATLDTWYRDKKFYEAFAPDFRH